MKMISLNTKMPQALIPYYEVELRNYLQCLSTANLPQAWSHLERAHVLAQAYPLEHTFVHFKMLQFGMKIKSSKEIIGQLPRLLLGGIKSFIGIIPTGNTGGSNVPPWKKMPIDLEIQEIFKKAGI